MGRVVEVDVNERKALRERAERERDDDSPKSAHYAQARSPAWWALMESLDGTRVLALLDALEAAEDETLRVRTRAAEEAMEREAERDDAAHERDTRGALLDRLRNGMGQPHMMWHEAVERVLAVLAARDELVAERDAARRERDEARAEIAAPVFVLETMYDDGAPGEDWRFEDVFCDADSVNAYLANGGFGADVEYDGADYWRRDGVERDMTSAARVTRCAPRRRA